MICLVLYPAIFYADNWRPVSMRGTPFFADLAQHIMWMMRPTSETLLAAGRRHTVMSRS
jgi:hypothetical protein